MSRTAESTEKLTADLKRVVRDSQELLRDSAEAVGEKGQAARERMAQTLESAKASYLRLQEKGRNGAQATDKAIREHPYQSLGVAFGLGVLLGALVVRK